MLLDFKHITPKSIEENPTVIKSGDNEPSRKRRPHHKSRSGCDTCRRRHYKCDEKRPECGQCLHGRRFCTYTISPLTSITTNSVKSTSVGRPNRYMSVQMNELPSALYHGDLSPLELLNHFYQTTDLLWMGSTQCQDILQRYTPQLALNSSFLAHAILAFSASHIAALSPERRRYEIAGIWHYSLALQSYRQAINDETIDADALFACCILLTLLSFKQISNDLCSAEFSKGQKRFVLDTVGIRFLSGPRILADAFACQSMLTQDLWEPLIRHCKEYLVENNNVLATSPRAYQAMAGLEAVCRGEELSSHFDSALTSLRLLMQCYVSDRHEMVELTFRFSMKLDPRFLRSVEQNAPKALLVMCYWYALVMQIDQWWASRTALVEGRKLLCSLRNTADSSIHALLDFPTDLLNARSSTT